jgi:hypothetical protein
MCDFSTYVFNPCTRSLSVCHYNTLHKCCTEPQYSAMCSTVTRLSRTIRAAIAATRKRFSPGRRLATHPTCNGLFSGGKVTLSTSSRAEVKNDWRYTSTPSVCLHDVYTKIYLLVGFNFVPHPQIPQPLAPVQGAQYRSLFRFVLGTCIRAS